MQTTSGRIPPAMPAAAYKTYSMLAPLASHWRPATCAEVECDAYLRGWVTVADERTDLGQAQAAYIRQRSGRRFTEHRDDAGLTRFTFEAGQAGFASRVADLDHSAHRIRLDREHVFIERGGDWRGNPRGDRRVHRRPDDWVDSFATHQDRLAALIRRG